MKTTVLSNSIRTEYIRVEDRMRLVGSDADGQPQAVWLTLRILQRMVPELLRLLEQAGTQLELSTAEQSAQEQAAAETAVEDAPVMAKGEAMLPSSVNIAATTQAIRLTFITEQEQIIVELAFDKMRQWLLLLKQVYKRAEWPSAVWPAVVETKPVAKVLH